MLSFLQLPSKSHAFRTEFIVKSGKFLALLLSLHELLLVSFEVILDSLNLMPLLLGKLEH